MEVRIIQNTAESAVITFEGHLDSSASEILPEKLAPVMNDAGKQIILDFTKLNYIASSGMRMLLMLNKKAVEKGGRVAIKGMNEDILQIFQMVGFDNIFDINSQFKSDQ